MFTQCPQCETVFRLSAADLKRAQGRVRCGDCSSVFNALESLREDLEQKTAPVSEPWLTDSADNPPRDLEPSFGDSYDLDEDDDAETPSIPAEWLSEAANDPMDEREPALGEDVFDDTEEDDTDSGILYVEENDEPATEILLTGNEETIPPGPRKPHPSYLEVDDFDASIWERVPGVGRLSDDNRPLKPQWNQPENGAEDDEDWLPENAEGQNKNEDDEIFVFSDSDDDIDEAEEKRVTETGESDAADEEWSPTIAPDNAPSFSTEPEESDDDFEDDVEAVVANKDDLEFNVPQDKWGNFFGAAGKKADASLWQAPKLHDDEDAEEEEDDSATESLETNDGEFEGHDDADGNEPSWRAGAPADVIGARRSSFAGLKALGGCVLFVGLAIQLAHYNRDRLATHPSYGDTVRTVYGLMNSELYPRWSLNDYEIRASEAVSGETGPDILDIRAQIAAVGKQDVGLPQLRVVLRDRWSNPVAARHFGPDEYAQDTDIPAGMMLKPGQTITAHLSIVDPGAGAQGFELELCIPQRNEGLQCTGQPFK